MTLLGRGGQLQLARTPHLVCYSNLNKGVESQKNHTHQEQFRQMIAEYLKLIRKREDMYCRIVRLQDIRYSEFENLLAEVLLLAQQIKQAKGIQSSFSLVDRKTLAYHLCAKLVELLEGLKDKLKSDRAQSIESNRQEILRTYRKMIDEGQFDATLLVDAMADFPRQPHANHNRSQGFNQVEDNDCKNRSHSTNPFHTNQTLTVPATAAEQSRNKFLLSTQVLSSKEKKHLKQFMQVKQHIQLKKAKIEQKSKADLKIIRQTTKQLYGPLQLDDLLKSEYCLTLTKESNMQCLVKRQLQRNIAINKTLNNFNDSQASHKLRSQSRKFRIRRKNHELLGPQKTSFNKTEQTTGNQQCIRSTVNP